MVELTAKLGVICGSGSSRMFPESKDWETLKVDTPFGFPSSSLSLGTLHSKPVAVLYRHGPEHTIPPHKINYRANIWALANLGVGAIIALTSVGGIHAKLSPGSIAIPDQLIDYTWGRENTFFEGGDSGVGHVEFTSPFCQALRITLLQAAKNLSLSIFERGTYGVMQGPRFETSAEIKRLLNDGCDLVGMTAMPEAALAAEKGISYACISLSVNWAAGIGTEKIEFEQLNETYRIGSKNMRLLVSEAIRIADESYSPNSEVFKL